MLAIIRDDTLNVLTMQHISPNSKRWDHSVIHGGGHKKDAPTWLKVVITFFFPDPHPHPILEKRLFQNLTLKIQVQGHGWGERWKSQHAVQHSIDSRLFRSLSSDHSIPEIRLFQNLTLKIQGQGHGWGRSWKSQSGCSILSTHFHFVPSQSTLPFLTYKIF